MIKLYKKGKKKIDNELNIIRLIQSHNIIQLFMKNNILNDKIRWMVAHCDKNIIDLECSHDQSSSDISETSKKECEHYDAKSDENGDQFIFKDTRFRHSSVKVHRTIHGRDIDFGLNSGSIINNKVQNFSGESPTFVKIDERRGAVQRQSKTQKLEPALVE